MRTTLKNVSVERLDCTVQPHTVKVPKSPIRKGAIGSFKQKVYDKERVNYNVNNLKNIQKYLLR